MAKKLFYSMGEVAELFDVNASLIRHWERKFDLLRPHKNKKGNRMFSPEDVENLKLIYHLVKERGMTLEGANRSLRRNKGLHIRDTELLERLQRVRSMLLEVREELRTDEQATIVADEPDSGPDRYGHGTEPDADAAAPDAGPASFLPGRISDLTDAPMPASLATGPDCGEAAANCADGEVATDGEVAAMSEIAVETEVIGDAPADVAAGTEAVADRQVDADVYAERPEQTELASPAADGSACDPFVADLRVWTGDVSGNAGPAESGAGHSGNLPACQSPASDGAQPAVRRPRRKRDGEGDKELFAFYEQSLF